MSEPVITQEKIEGGGCYLLHALCTEGQVYRCIFMTKILRQVSVYKKVLYIHKRFQRQVSVYKKVLIQNYYFPVESLKIPCSQFNNDLHAINRFISPYLQ